MGLIVTTNGAGYTTPAKVRTTAGLKATTDVSDADLGVFIIYASRCLSRDIGNRVFQEPAKGALDGVNVRFTVANPYLADRDLDGQVGVADVDAYYCVPNADGTVTRTKATISTVDAFTGTVTLLNPPPKEAARLEVDYEFYRVPVYTDTLEQATNALAAHLVYLRNKDPASVTLAQLRGVGSSQAWVDGGIQFSQETRFLREYLGIVRRIKAGEVR